MSSDLNRKENISIAKRTVATLAGGIILGSLVGWVLPVAIDQVLTGGRNFPLERSQ